MEDGRISMHQLLQQPIMPDGIFSASALGAVGALQVLKEKGINVPEQVAIVGFSNELYTSFIDPPISTVEQHSERIGNAAAEIFLQEILNRNTKFIPQKIVLKPELLIRKSSLKKGL